MLYPAPERMSLYETKLFAGIGPHRYRQEGISGDRVVIPQQIGKTWHTANSHPDEERNGPPSVFNEEVDKERNEDKQRCIIADKHNEAEKKACKKAIDHIAVLCVGVSTKN